MIRYVVLLSALGLLAAFSSGMNAPAEKMPKESCLTPTFTCANECLACMKFCRENKMEDTAKECEICHHACLMCGLAVETKNARAWEACDLCEKTCNDCAVACEKGTNPQMKKCAEACRNCAKACAESRK